MPSVRRARPSARSVRVGTESHPRTHLADRPDPSKKARETAHQAARTLAERGAYREAVVAYEALLAAHPGLSTAYFELAGMLDRQFQRPDLAVSVLTNGLQRAPHDAARFCNSLGVFKLRARDVDAALGLFTRAVEADPKLADAHANLGVIHYERNALGPALEHYQRAVELAPQSVALLQNYTLVLSRSGRGDEAAKVGRRAVKLEPHNPTAWHHLGIAHQHSGRTQDALAALRRSASLPGHSATFHSDLLLISLYDPRASMAQLVEAHRDWARCHAPPPRFRFAPRPADRRWRIGYVSADFRAHPVGQFLAPVVAAHDRASFEVFAYSSTPNEDALTRHFEHHVEHFRRVATLDDVQLADLVHRDGIDILVDLAGHTANNRLITFAQKPAPIQVSWLGYPFTTGLDAIDYFISDRFETPEGFEAWFTEKLVRMPNGYLCVRPPEEAPPVGPLPASSESVFTFGCFNNLSKVTAEVVETWSEILKATQPSRLLLQTRELDDPQAQAELRARFARQGVKGEQLVLAGGTTRNQLLARYGLVDLALDPFPYCGGLTTCEAMWMGVPVVTWPGERFCGRHSLSHASQVGLTMFTADSRAAYRDIACAWRRDLDSLSALRASLRPRMQESPLVDGTRFTRDLEREFVEMARANGR